MLQKSFYKKSGFCQTFSFPVNWGFVYLSKLIVQYFRPFVIFLLSIMMITKNIVPDEKLTKEIKQTFFLSVKDTNKNQPLTDAHILLFITLTFWQKVFCFLHSTLKPVVLCCKSNFRKHIS